MELYSILRSIAWAIRTTIHTVTNYSPAQLVFNKDMIMQMQINVDWQILKQKRLITTAKRNNDKEHASRIQHEYKLDYRILIVSLRSERTYMRKLSSPIEGPYVIANMYKNGTVEVERMGFFERINIRRTKPYLEESQISIL